MTFVLFLSSGSQDNMLVESVNYVASRVVEKLMGASFRLWIRVLLSWLGVLALTLLVGSFGIAKFADPSNPESNGWIVPVVMASLTMWIGYSFFQRRAYKDEDAPQLRVEATFQVMRPVGEVFTFMTDVANEPLMTPMIIEAVMTSPGPARVGATYREKIRLGLRTISTNFTITEYDPPHRYAVRGHVGTRPCIGYYLGRQTGPDGGRLRV